MTPWTVDQGVTDTPSCPAPKGKRASGSLVRPVRPTLASGIAASLIYLTSVSPTWALILVTVVAITLMWGIALPAVWSSDGERREAARATLRLVLTWTLQMMEAILGKRSSRG